MPPSFERYIQLASGLLLFSVGVYHPHLKGISNITKPFSHRHKGVYHPHLKGISNRFITDIKSGKGVYHPHLKGLFK